MCSTMGESVDDVLVKRGMSSGDESQYHTERCRIVEQYSRYRRVSRETLNGSWVECRVCSDSDEQSSVRVSRVCPLCDERVPNLPQHMRACR